MMLSYFSIWAHTLMDEGKTMPLPDIGTTPPAFTLPNQHGEAVSLADYAGKNVLIWFYPRAFGNG